MTYGIWQSKNGQKYICSIYRTVGDIINDNNTRLLNVVNKYGVSVLPIRQNAAGGWCGLNDSLDTFLGEYEEKPVLGLDDIWIKNSPHFELGWISPAGDTYDCGEYSHLLCAKDIANTFFGNYNSFINPDKYLINHGWVKVYKAFVNSMWRKSFNGSLRNITRKQWIVIDKFQIPPDWHVSREMKGL